MVDKTDRCRHCAYLVDNNGIWWCDDYDKECDTIDYCPAVEDDSEEEI